MNRPDPNTNPLKIAVLCGAASALLTATLLFAGTIETLLLVIGLITSASIGLLVYHVLRRVEPDFESDTLELLFQLSKDEKVDPSGVESRRFSEFPRISFFELT